jgi:hypothetical protein
MVEGTDLNGVSVYLVDMDNGAKGNGKKIELITDFGEFVFNEGKIKTWKYFNIGEGKNIDVKFLEKNENKGKLTTIKAGGATLSNAESGSSNFWVHSSYVGEGHHTEESDLEKYDNINYEDPENAPVGDDEAIFEDQHEGCSATYKSFGALLRHLTKEKHVKSFQRYRVEDYALATYLGKIEEIDRTRSIPVIVEDLRIANYAPATPDDITPEMGWAHIVRKNSRWSDDVHQFLDELFDRGVKDKTKKINAKLASDLIKTATLEDGITKRFKFEDRLKPDQIAGYFSRKADALKNPKKKAKTKRNADNIEESREIMNEIIKDEGDPTLVYKYDPMEEDEYDEIYNRYINK